MTFSVYLGERVEDLVANRLDMSIRVGNLPDSSPPSATFVLTTECWWPRRLTLPPVERLLRPGAASSSLHGAGRHGVVMNEWRFEDAGKEQVIRVTPAMVCDDGALLRQWAQQGGDRR